jgi:hypothetical protein
MKRTDGDVYGIQLNIQVRRPIYKSLESMMLPQSLDGCGNHVSWVSTHFSFGFCFVID